MMIFFRFLIFPPLTPSLLRAREAFTCPKGALPPVNPPAFTSAKPGGYIIKLGIIQIQKQKGFIQKQKGFIQKQKGFIQKQKGFMQKQEGFLKTNQPSCFYLIKFLYFF